MILQPDIPLFTYFHPLIKNFKTIICIGFNYESNDTNIVTFRHQGGHTHRSKLVSRGQPHLQPTQILQITETNLRDLLFLVQALFGILLVPMKTPDSEI